MCESGNVHCSEVVYKSENVYLDTGRSENARSEERSGAFFVTGIQVYNN